MSIALRLVRLSIEGENRHGRDHPYIADVLLGDFLRERIYAPPALPNIPVPTVGDHLALGQMLPTINQHFLALVYSAIDN